MSANISPKSVMVSVSGRPYPIVAHKGAVLAGVNVDVINDTCTVRVAVSYAPESKPDLTGIELRGESVCRVYPSGAVHTTKLSTKYDMKVTRSDGRSPTANEVKVVCFSDKMIAPVLEEIESKLVAAGFFMDIDVPAFIASFLPQKDADVTYSVQLPTHMTEPAINCTDVLAKMKLGQ